jgi:hypothetical protein
MSTTLSLNMSMNFSPVYRTQNTTSRKKAVILSVSSGNDVSMPPRGTLKHYLNSITQTKRPGWPFSLYPSNLFNPLNSTNLPLNRGEYRSRTDDLLLAKQAL